MQRRTRWSDKTLPDVFTRPRKTGWQFAAFTEYCDEFIVSAFSKAKPIATPRFYRGPGEAYGRGPLMMALPTIKTANKAQEIASESAAIQMLGIWAYRAGSAFNPNAVKAGPGEMWALESTGGILGPDITRLDTPNARFDIAKMVIGD
ncbi:MAG: portal protein [Ahrensia sp.]|nr:portal protein [Ahrensia sp.]